MKGPRPKLGPHHGEYVPLSIEEFREGYDTFSAAITGELPRDPGFPAAYEDAATGEERRLDDTPFNRAWYAAGKLFDDDARRISFYVRVEKVMPIATSAKYGKFIDRDAGSFHIALLGAIAMVEFSPRTTPKSLRAAFDAEFRRLLAASVESGDGETRH